VDFYFSLHAWESCTEFHPTYDYKAIGIGQHDKAQ
jgi:hypothetical protein